MFSHWITCAFIIALKLFSSSAEEDFQQVYQLNPSRTMLKSPDQDQPRVENKYKTKDSGPLAINSPVCQLRSRCYTSDDLLTRTADDVRNCFCDALCATYDDCCHDYKPSAAPVTRLRDVADCRPLSNLTATQSLPSDVHVWVINRCPSDYHDAFIRGRCEKVNPLSTTSDSFYRLPVFGPNFRALYANVYCALCAGEENAIFWNAELRCNTNVNDSSSRITSTTAETPSLNKMQFLRALINSGKCLVEFVQNERMKAFLSGPTTNRNDLRGCINSIDRCDRRWADAEVDRKCRQRTEYVYAGNRAFRNSDCARCNYVNETYLKCERAILADDDTNAKSTFVENVYAPVVVKLDYGAREAFVNIREQSSKFVKESKIEFESCGGTGGSIYDPFSGKCHLLFCTRETGEEFRNGRCSKKVTLMRTGDEKRPSKSITSRGRNNDDDDDIDYDDDDYKKTDNNNLMTTAHFESTTPARSTKNIYSDPHPECDRIYREDYYIVDDNDGTIYVRSRNVVLDRDRYYFDKTHALFICPLPHDLDEERNNTFKELYEPMKLTIVHLSSPYQRLASIAGLVLSILCLLASIAANVAYPELRSGTFGKSFLSLMFSLLVAHSLYLAIQIVERCHPEQLTCFCLSASAQFASLAAVLWLNVMSIIVFNAILRTHSAATTTPTALNERPGTSDSISPSTGFASIFIYSLYAWVVPLAVVAVSVAVAAFGIDGNYDTDERVDGCWSLGLTQLLLLVVPITLVFVANFAMHSVIFFRLCLRPIRVHTLSLGGGNSLSRQTTFSHLETQTKITRQEQAMREMKVHEKRYMICFQLTVVMAMAWTFAVIATFTHWTLMTYLFAAFDTFLAACVCFAALCNTKFCYLIGKRRRALRITDEGRGGARSHFEVTSGGKYCMLDMDGGTTSYLKDDKNNIVLRETSI